RWPTQDAKIHASKLRPLWYVPVHKNRPAPVIIGCEIHRASRSLDKTTLRQPNNVQCYSYQLTTGFVARPLSLHVVRISRQPVIWHPKDIVAGPCGIDTEARQSQQEGPARILAKIVHPARAIAYFPSPGASFSAARPDVH